MRKNFLCKCLVTLGLVLLFSVTVPLFPNNTISAEASETGKNKSDSYRLNLDSIKIAKGDTKALKVYNAGDNAKINFKSSDDEIASVNDNGVVYAKRVGDAVITVSIKDGSDSQNLTCDVSISPAAVSVKWTQSIVILGKNNVDTLNAILKPSTYEDAKFTTSNSDVATISPGGRVTAQGFGFAEMKAFIDATDSDGSRKYDSCGVIVVDQDEVSKLKDYFDNHSELLKISDNELFKALDKFFNKEYDSKTSLVSSLNRYLNKTFSLN